MWASPSPRTTRSTWRRGHRHSHRRSLAGHPAEHTDVDHHRGEHGLMKGLSWLDALGPATLHMPATADPARGSCLARRAVPVPRKICCGFTVTLVAALTRRSGLWRLRADQQGQ